MQRKRNVMEKKRNDFSELSDLCFANGWDLQEKIEWDDELVKDIIAYFIKSGFNLREMYYALSYLTQCFMNYTSWHVNSDRYYEFCEEHREEMTDIIDSALEGIQVEAEIFYSKISRGKKNDWK